MPPARTPSSTAARRPRGTGSLFVKRDGAGRETWYGKWRVGDAQVKRRIGLRRVASTREGLTRAQAEAELRRLMGSAQYVSTEGGQITVQEAGEMLVESSRARAQARDV